MPKKNKREDEYEEVEDTVEPTDTKFKKTTHDSALCAYHRLIECEFDRENVNFNDIATLIAALVLFYFGIFMQGCVVILFRLISIQTMTSFFDEPQLNTTMTMLNTAISNRTAVDEFALSSLCNKQQRHTVTHILMLFMWCAMISPQVWERLWTFYNICRLPTEPADEDDPNEHEAPNNQEFTLREKKKAAKEDKTVLLLDDDGAKCKGAKKEGKDAGAKNAKKPKKDGVYGKNWIADWDKPEKEKVEGRWITWMGLCTKMVVLFLVYVPDIVMLLYTGWTGCKYLAYEGDIEKLVIKALVLKSVLKLPAMIFKTFVGEKYADYVSKSGLRVMVYDADDLNPQVLSCANYWNLWVGPFTKFILCFIWAIMCHNLFFTNVRDVRDLCVDLMNVQTGPDAATGCVGLNAMCPGCEIPGNTCGFEYGQL